MTANSKQELEEIQALLRNNIELLKPIFGMTFWELASAESVLSAEDFASNGMSLNLEAEDDEIVAAFMSSYVQIWMSAKDFNAASRFIASTLSMSADELLQCRQMYLDSKEQI